MQRTFWRANIFGQAAIIHAALPRPVSARGFGAASHLYRRRADSGIAKRNVNA